MLPVNKGRGGCLSHPRPLESTTGAFGFCHGSAIVRVDLVYLMNEEQQEQRQMASIIFKLAMITFKCLHGLAPSYLADVCTPVSSVVGRWQLWSAGH